MTDATYAGVGNVRFEHDGSLAQRALRLLTDAPMPTADVARFVLGLRGEAGAAAVAVFTLLGRDPRFVVSADGVWSVASAPTATSCRLCDEDFVVVDVETTGGSPGSGHRVTEVAAVRVHAGEVRETFSSLVNPERRIPSQIVALTGITQEMVQDAPTFREIAGEVADIVGGRIFVAHNAPFDWRFITSEMERSTGTTPAGRTLCTVRLARRLMPQLPSRSLGALADYFGLEIESRHRALDDAVATAKVLLRFMGMLQDEGVDDWAALEGYINRRTPRAKRRATPRSMREA